MAHSNTRLPVQRLGARRQRLGQVGVDGVDGVAHAGHGAKSWWGERAGNAVVAARMCCFG
jgi:hypothetical protein